MHTGGKSLQIHYVNVHINSTYVQLFELLCIKMFHI